MNVSLMRNVASRLYAVPVFAVATHTAGGGQDGSPVNGLTFNRGDLVQDALSGLLVIPYTVAGLDGGNGVLVEITVQDSADGINDFTDYDAVVADTDVEENGSGVVQAAINLGGARQYVRFVIETTFDASGTDTFAYSGSLVLGGFNELPVAEDTSGDSF